MAVTQVGLGYPANTQIYQNTDLTKTKSAIKAASAVVYAIEVDNSLNAAEAEYLKLYNAAEGDVTVGTTVPDFVLYIPAAAVFNLVIPAGLVFGTALTIAASTTGGTIATADPTSNLTARVVYA
jgi:hypothetical protein